MAPKRAAKKAAPPPPPLPPAESSDEDTRSDESEDEEAIADSPVPALTPALKNKPAPSQTAGESESSEEDGDEDDDDDDDDEEEEPVRAPAKNQPPPPQKEEDSDTSGSDGEEEEEEEEEAAPKKQPSPARKNQPPPALEKSEESDGSDDEEEEDEVPTRDAPPSVPKKDLKPPAAAAETKRRGAFQRIWSTGDEVRILEALAAHQKQHGALPQPEALMDVLAGKLDNPAYSIKELQSKVRSLRTRYLTLSKRGDRPSKEHDCRLLDLSKIVWDSDKTTPAAVAAATNAVNGHEHKGTPAAVAAATNAVNGHEHKGKGFEEMCELYPYLAEEVKGLEVAHPGMFKRQFGKIDDDKARAMDEKIKKQRVVQIKLEMRRADLTKEVTKALCDLVDG